MIKIVILLIVGVLATFDFATPFSDPEIECMRGSVECQVGQVARLRGYCVKCNASVEIW